MKKIKSLVIYYIMLISLSLISLFSFKHKGNDFFVALSSITADLSFVLSIILIVYAILFCCNKCKKNINKSILSSLLILFITMVVIFLSFVNIYSHRNIFEYIIRVINKKENLDIIILFLESLFVYIFIFLCSLIGIILNNYYIKYKKIGKYPIILITIVLLFIMILVNIGVKLLLFVWIIDIILYIIVKLLIKKI